MRVDINLLACPECRGELAANADETVINCSRESCRMAYPVRDGMPILIVKEGWRRDR